MSNSPEVLHFIGIGGSGASAVAALAQAAGYQVTGCDLDTSSNYLKDLSTIAISQGHAPAHINKVDLVVVSPAILSLDADNEELKAAHNKKIPLMTWQEFMGKFLQKDKFVIAVAGTHGKSTTCAMIGMILEAAGLDPTVEVGAIVRQWGKNYRLGQGKYFVCEADEFNDNFLNYYPDLAVITNIEFDHPEYFQNEQQLQTSFAKFISQVKSGGRVLRTSEVAKVKYNLSIPGEFNQDNASLAAACAQQLGIDELVIKSALENFSGVGRRFEQVGEVDGVKVFDDYAHHPTAIVKTLQAFRQKFSNEKIFCVFQPHMFSRTRALFDDFVKAFQNAPVDEVIVVDIFASREKATGRVTSRQLVEAIGKDHVKYLSSLEAAYNWLKSRLVPGSIVVCMGAGDINKLSRKLVNNE
ncbi:UDP-N-acetylmuramate--L-alanine ligase [Candidatus Daviesbacteria bacterium]|nr:UDP-N-acetylmuramate--L-alanine ligase [Candidatus Daviesbacteria bacterium]